MTHPWARLPEALHGTALERRAHELADQAHRSLAAAQHGDLARWRRALATLPVTTPLAQLNRPSPQLGTEVADPVALRDLLMELHPWRKGPLELGGVYIDTEWRSDRKWDRVAPHLDLSGDTVLDVGCGNGYFGWRMLAAGARCVVGVDPTLVFVMQWLAQIHFAPDQPNFVLPMRDQDLGPELTGFDCAFSMGVLYHRRKPLGHLSDLHRWLRPGGRLVLETLVLDRPGRECLVPGGRYARMRNVRFIPSPDLLVNEMGLAGFVQIRVVDLSATTTDEQRSTPWMRFESLAQCLDPEDSARTVEGYPAPVRAMVLAERAG